jgi:hypothetical protein
MLEHNLNIPKQERKDRVLKMFSVCSKPSCKAAIFLTTLLFISIDSFTQASTPSRSQLNSLKAQFATRGGSVVAVENAQSSNHTSGSVNNSTLFSFKPADSTERIDTNDNFVPGNKALKVLFLSADTGGGHRASAESLANQVRSHHNLDIWKYFTGERNERCLPESHPR